MTILLKVYAGWTNADEDVADWSHAFPDSATAEDIARELYNREHAEGHDFKDHVTVVNYALQDLDFSGPHFRGNFKKGYQPGTQLTGWRIVKIGRV